jgi:hypothetical protein
MSPDPGKEYTVHSNMLFRIFITTCIVSLLSVEWVDQTVSLNMPHLDTFLESFPVYEATIKYVTSKRHSSDFLPDNDLPKHNNCLEIDLEALNAMGSERFFQKIENFDHAIETI